MNLPWFYIGALGGALAVVLGAVGGHGLAAGSRAAELQNTASLYHFAHVFAIFVVGFLSKRAEAPSKLLAMAGSLFTAGTVLFSGSLYLSALMGIAGSVVTPLGGLSLIAGWLVLAIYGFIDWRRGR